ncbi:MAG: ABC transporter ATP-binding protein [Acidobacteria bacterium]|nr:ABC transporter ATP-binding protein [Acidobacteriota bacterium]
MIRLENITKTYIVGETEVRALRGVSNIIPTGDFVAIMGASGSGKSTLMNIIGCLDKPTSGRYFLDGEDISTLSRDALAGIRNRKIGFVFQSFNLLPRTTALENVELPLIYANVSHKERLARARASLAAVGLKGREAHKTNQLSGGEQQRVAIARALLNKPRLILADEPTGNLDSKTSDEIMNVFERLNHEDGISIVMVTHEPDIGARAKRRLHMKDGLVVRED